MGIFERLKTLSPGGSKVSLVPRGDRQSVWLRGCRDGAVLDPNAQNEPVLDLRIERHARCY
jgi:hypothetical protein